MMLMLALLILAQVFFAFAQSGQWRVIGNSPVVGIHMAIAASPDASKASVIMWERFHGLHYPSLYPANPFTYVPSIQQSEITALCELPIGAEVGAPVCAAKHVEYSVFCGGSAIMDDGRVLVVSGDGDNVGNGYIKDGRYAIQIFSGTTKEWSFVALTQTPRWYPTTIILPDKRYLAVGGHRESYLPSDPSRNNPTFETYPASGPARTLDILIPTYPYNMYPMVYFLPTNRIFVFAGTKVSFLLTKAALLDFPSLNLIATLPDLAYPELKPRSFPFTATSVMLPLWPSSNYKAEILVCGGTRNDNNAASNCDRMVFPDSNSGVWVKEEDMPVPRVMGDFVLLPNGNVVIVNGARIGTSDGPAGHGFAKSPSFEACLYNPTVPSGKWSILAPASVPRLYHSSAILLPTAQVLTGGSDQQNYDNPALDPFEYRLEVFSPFYGDGDRPIIVNVEGSTIPYNTEFAIVTQGNVMDGERGIVIIRHGSSTHSTNMDQRLVGLVRVMSIPIGGNVVRHVLRSPPTPSIAPLGPWMLFVLSPSGVPSVAKTITLQ